MPNHQGKLIGRIALAVVFLLACACAPGRAAELRLNPAAGAFDVLPFSDVLRDPTGTWTIADIRRRDAQFASTGRLVPDLGFSILRPSTLWFRFRPRSTGGEPWFLEPSMETDRAQLYFVPARGRPERRDFGMLVPFADRDLPSLGVAVELPAESLKSGVIYLRTVTREDTFGQMSLRPRHHEALQGRLTAEDEVYPELVVCGIVGALGLFNLLLGLMLRETIYVRYALAMGSFAVYEAAESGLAWRWLWPHVSWSYDITSYAVYLVYLAFVVTFADAFLGLRRTQKQPWRFVLITYALVSAVDVSRAFYPNLLDRTGYAGLIETLANALLVVGILGCGFVAWRRNFVGAGSFTIAFAGVAIGIIVGISADNTIIPETAWTDSAPGVGVAWESFFLALAVAKRIDRLRGERDALATAAFTDALTGIPNRRAFDHRMHDEWVRAVRDETPLSIVLLDVDWFKAYNDRYGHPAGDDVLGRVARMIARTLRGTDDVVARYGGEEFIVLLPRCDAAGAERVAEAMRTAIERLAITVSAGVASITPTHNDTPAALIEVADRALYRAKRDGRNRVVVSHDAVA